MADELMWTIGGDGKVSDVKVKDWEKWIEFNPGKRPPGTGPNGEWTVEDERAALDVYDENKDYYNYPESFTEEGGEREIWDILADEAAITGPQRGVLEEPMEFDREAADDINEWSAGARVPLVSGGPTPEMFKRFRQEAAKEAIGRSATKRPSESEYRTYEGFGEWKPTQKWHDEQFTGPLTDEQRLPIGRGGVED